MNTTNPTGGQKTDTKPDSFAILLGGNEILVTRQDGRTETVKVLKLPIKQFPALLKAITGSEEQQAEVYCGQPSGWAETLDRESMEKVIIEGEELNVSFFERWYQRQRKRNEIMMPGITEKVVSSLMPKKELAQSPSPSSAQK